MKIHRYQTSYDMKDFRDIEERKKKKKVAEDNLYFKGVGILNYFGDTFKEVKKDSTVLFSFHEQDFYIKQANKIIRQRIGRWIERKRFLGTYKYLGTIDLPEDLMNEVISLGKKSNRIEKQFRKKAKSLVTLL
ncbi:MAG: hypothetical protein PHH54_03665 [Candidatus Nanoarchaeia archaeon]|nr:hypothetical protein [Candidatus Nanoarchaeia archaeon]MDD5741056.1 hypothetical protein [Candidatus Nanoarchaeia archaeon]